MCVYPNIMAVPNSSPSKTLPEFIARAKAEPGKVTYASSGIGTSLHLAGELFKRMAGVDLTHIPYRGAGPGAERSHPRPRRCDLRELSLDAALCAAGTVARPCGDDREAPARGAGPAGDRRVRAGLRCVVVVRAVRRGEDAGRDRREAASRLGRGTQSSAREGALRAARRNGGRLHARRSLRHFFRPRSIAGVR